VWSGSARAQNAFGKIGLSFTSIILIATIALAGPVGGALVGAATHLFELNRQPTTVRIFNSGMTSAVGSIGGLAYLAVGGLAPVTPSSTPVELLLRVGLPMILADMVLCLANAVILAGIVRIHSGTPVKQFVLTMLSTSGLAYVGYGVIGLLFVILWVPAEVGPFSALLVLAPLFVARWAFVQYGDEQRAHERTLSALVAAVETKDPVTRGHSERIAQLCELMAGSLSLGHQRTEALRYAGMLHDIGMLGIPSRLLHKTAPLTDDELATIALHPVRGLEMVRGIDFLKESFDGILHHHERFDGLGYPEGLAGPQIPDFARIIAVADAFDSLTTERPGRTARSTAEALEELHERAGSQFDPAVVAAFERALARHDWRPLGPDGDSVKDGEPVKASPGAFDHDDPAVSDALVLRTELVTRLQRSAVGSGRS